jgi:hypothetical protein
MDESRVEESSQGLNSDAVSTVSTTLAINWLPEGRLSCS